MSQSKSLVYNVEPIWNLIDKIRKNVETALEDFDAQIRAVSIMVASELIENAIKYGASIKEGEGIRFELIIENNLIQITVKNKIAEVKDLDNFKGHIELIKTSDNFMELYVSRLEKLLTNKTIEKSELGLYRIVADGQFTINYDYKDDILSVIAYREINPD